MILKLYQEALQCFDQEIKLQPKFQTFTDKANTLYIWLIYFLYFNYKDFKKQLNVVIKLFNQLQIVIRHFSIKLLLQVEIYCYFYFLSSQKKYQDAIKCYDEAYQRGKHPMILLNKGLLYQIRVNFNNKIVDMNKREEAKIIFKQILDTNFQDKEYIRGLIKTL